VEVLLIEHCRRNKIPVTAATNSRAKK
jgi:hypothetical protein